MRRISMALKQTNLTDKEEKVFKAVKQFLVEKQIIPTNTNYAMVKYCIANVCSQTVDVLKNNQLELSTIGLTDEDLFGIFKLRARAKK